MPHISIEPVSRVNVFVDLSEIRDFAGRALLRSIVDEVTAFFVPANTFWDECEIDGANNRIKVNFELEITDFAEFERRLKQAVAIHEMSKV
jgi:hypothetical protein